jgi:hypothetical protein
LELAFANPSQGFMSTGGLGGPASQPFLLRTSDGGRTWRPQVISDGTVGAYGIVATTAVDAYALALPGVTDPRITAGGEDLFFTHAGGDIGQPSKLTIATAHSMLSRRQLKKANGKVTITGTLASAVGGEQIVVSRRDQRGVSWTSQVISAGANGGSFTAAFKISRSSIFVAQWAGDSGRQSAGTALLRVRVK